MNSSIVKSVQEKTVLVNRDINTFYLQAQVNLFHLLLMKYQQKNNFTALPERELGLFLEEMLEHLKTLDTERLFDLVNDNKENFEDLSMMHPNLLNSIFSELLITLSFIIQYEKGDLNIEHTYKKGK